ncbi:uncharacterized protein K02A2.6-like [Sabethes cyaneus]|uniref:uncharacterized protein K02A2.6-like n=1 Tax=Sabethes cyaneus TaxID=53552 RepID=UPI00237E2807|nr:uncharacterized protein K02A2.6-like [Sabethes cyaneus]
MCADYSTGLYSDIQPNQHPLPLPEEIFAKLSDIVFIVFSHIDLPDAYFQIPVEKDSRQYLTINTHCGLFEFNRLPPDVKSAPGTFQKIVDVVAGLEGWLLERIQECCFMPVNPVSRFDCQPPRDPARSCQNSSDM